MRKSLLVFAALVPLVGVATFASLALPADAESDDDSCAIQPALDAVPFDLNAIPAQPVTGSMAVRGVGDDEECDDTSIGGPGDDDHDGEGGGDSDD